MGNLLEMLNPDSVRSVAPNTDQQILRGSFTQKPRIKTNLGYYPSTRYIEKNLAPETELQDYDFKALALARKVAEQNGVLSPELASKLLPMALVEGRSGNYGVISGPKHGFYAKPSTIKRFIKMGVKIGNTDDSEMTIRDLPGKGPHLVITGGPKGPESYARMMAAILAEKASLVKSGDTDTIIRRFNGKGTAIEDLGGEGTQKADVNIYLQKVKEAEKMLAHPKNKTMMDYYMQAYVTK